MTHRTPRSEAVESPTRDGKPMAETDEHGVEMQTFALDVLRAHFAPDPNVHVSGNNFIYSVQGVPRACVSPDVYVVKGEMAQGRSLDV